MQPRVEPGPTPVDRGYTTRERTPFKILLDLIPLPDPEPGTDPNISYKQKTSDVAESDETEIILLITKAVIGTINQFVNAPDNDGKVVSCDTIIAAVIDQQGISRSDVIIGIFEAVATGQATVVKSSDGTDMITTLKI